MPLFNWVPPLFAKTKFPAGIILPMLSGAVPANWSSFTDADGKFIVGAGGSYGVTTTGGSSSVAISGSLATGGAHTGSSVSIPQESSGGTRRRGSTTRSHSHAFSDSAVVEDVNRSYNLIKADVAVDVLPPEVGVFGHGNLIHPLSNTHGSVDRFMKAGPTDGVLAGSNVPVSSGYSSSSNGAHTHGSVTGGCDFYYNDDCKHLDTVSGSHAHTGTTKTTLNTKHFYLSLWKHATAGCLHQKNMIGMWEGATAPAGWRLCNGLDGTPDLRDYFIRIGSTGQQGVFGGTNSSTWVSNSQSSAGGHAHARIGTTSGSLSSSQACYHESTTGAHSNHPISSVATYLPPYYALSFIIKI